MMIMIAAATFQVTSYGVEVDPVADLVQAQQLVLDESVVELEAAGADEQAADQRGQRRAPPAAEVGEQEQPGDDGEEAEGVEQTVGNQTELEGRLVVEVVPVQQLVEYGLVDEGDKPDPGQYPGQHDPTGGLLAAAAPGGTEPGYRPSLMERGHTGDDAETAMVVCSAIKSSLVGCRRPNVSALARDLTRTCGRQTGSDDRTDLTCRGLGGGRRCCIGFSSWTAPPGV